MKILRFLSIFVLLVFCSGCNSQVKQKVEQKNEFIEVRITRWTALEGGETFVMRKINKDWSAMLLGNGDRFSCLYQYSVQPKSDWENFWLSLQKEGLLEISDGQRENGMLDGSGFIVEVFYQDKLKRYSFDNPKISNTKESAQVLGIGDLISREFDTPVFVANYSRAKVGDYLIEKCKDVREVDKK